ncbi:hemagglutinin repeat-containing protein [Candidatus Symbiopectobacterium sp. NZEC127]|uniref:hemagglutinin repeat-containing protein n=1 Tax=Candidatus Symbiopectobacterium sp. NZEC127 TaxID=2820472 RepID=UPI002225C2D3|nr:hemagglutinin repeat-containing protein [Candidatus Symbiopectobacterium sp. NZEC127]MCW2485262.1 hemagglutinin repeat-containing protein [Candidatus Symbiopectobacterium sp. NZEC127]
MRTINTAQRYMAYLLMGLIAWQPLLPTFAAGVNVATGNTAVDKAGNGVPIINIATPNAAGVSHNQYHDFNVDKKGLILNNGTDQLTATQLGGLIQNNPNLKGKAADAIINEVVSTQRSQLAGYLEVGGKQASVIVANPNGITCDGCGFINTPNVTLTTGTPQLDAQGNLHSINVQRGDITLSGQGLDASKSDYLGLIARTAQIDAGLNGNDVRLVLGANQVNADGSITAQTAPQDGVKVALDSGALGGMYSNRIVLISNDKGVGVNLGNISARSGDITLSANGTLRVGDAVAQGNLSATGDTLALQGKQQAGGALTLSAQQNINIKDATLRAGKQIDAQAGGRLQASNSTLSAGVNAQGTVGDEQNLRLKGDNVTLLSTQLAAGNVVAQATNALTQDAKSGIKAGRQLTLQGRALTLAGEADAQDIHLEAHTLKGESSAKWQAKNGANFGLSQQGQWSGAMTAGNALRVEGGALTQRGTLAADTITLQLDALTNLGDIAARGDLTWQGATLNNRGSLAAGQTFQLQGNALNNAGTLSASRALALELQDVLDNQGHLLAGDALSLTSLSMLNQGKVQAENITLDVQSLQNQGDVIAEQQLEVQAETLDNAGVLNAQRLIALQGGTLNNSGTLSAGEKMTLALGSTLTNRGMVQSGHDLRVQAGHLDNQGTLSAADLHLKADSLRNQGNVQATRDADIAVAEALTQTDAGTLLAGGQLVLDAATADTQGDIQAQQFAMKAQRWLQQGSVGIRGDGDIQVTDWRNQGQMVLGGNGVLSGASLVNSGSWQSAALEWQGDTLINQGRLQSLGSLGISASERISNSGSILAANALDLFAPTLINDGDLQGLTLSAAGTALTNRGQMAGANRLSITLSGNLDNQGVLMGTEALTLAVDERLSNGGEVLSQGTITASARQLSNDGQWQGNALALTAQTLRNAGTLLGTNALTLSATAALDNLATGKLQSRGSALLHAEQITNLGEWQAENITLTAHSLTNAGAIQSADALTLTLDGAMGNAGTFSAGGNSTLRAASVDNQGAISSRGAALFDALSLQNDGSITSSDNLTLHGNYQGNGSLSTAAQLALQGERLSQNGEWQADNLTVNATRFTHNGTLRAHVVALSLTELFNNGQIDADQTLALTLGNMDNRGNVNAGDMTLRATTLTNSGSLASQHAMELHLVDSLDNSGVITAQGAVEVTAERLQQWGTLEGQRLTLNAASLDNRGKLLGVEALTLHVADAIFNSGYLLSQGDASIQTTALENTGQWQAKRIDVNAARLTNSGSMLGGDALTLTLAERLDNSASGKLFSQGIASINAANVVNLGEWQASQLMVQANRFDNQGRMQGDALLSIETVVTPAPLTGRIAALGAQTAQPALTNQGTLLSGGELHLNGQQIENSGTLLSDAMHIGAHSLRNHGDITALTTLNAELSSVLDNDGAISGENVAIVAERIANSGDVSGKAQLALAVAQDLENSGTLYSQRLGVDALNLLNDGKVTGATALELHVLGDVYNSGTLAGRQLTLDASALANDGNIVATQNGYLHLQSQLNNRGLISGQGALRVDAGQVQQAATLEAQTLTLQADTLDNSGTLLGVDALTLAIVAEAKNSGKWLSQGDSVIQAARLDNQGTVQAERLHMDAQQMDNAGQILGLSALTLDVQGGLNNHQTGKLLSQGVATLHAADVTNLGEWQADHLLLSAARVTNSGRIQGNSALTMDLGADPHSTLHNQGRLISGGSSQLAAALIDNSGVISSQGQSGLTANSLLNSGNIVASEGVTLQGNYRGTGNLTTDGQLTFRGDSLENAGVWQGKNLDVRGLTLTNSGSLLGDDVTLYADHVTNQGALTGVKAMHLLLDAGLNNAGTINSYLLTLNAENIENDGQINGIDAFTLLASGALHNTGNGMLYGSALTLGAGSLDNQGDITGVDSLDLTLAQRLDNRGTLNSNHLTATAQQAENRGTITGVKVLTVTLNNALTNAGALQSKALTLIADTLTNLGQLTGYDTASLRLNQTLENSGNISGQRLAIAALSALNQGQLLGVDDLQLTLIDQLDNRSQIGGSGTVQVTANNVQQAGSLEGRQVGVNAEVFDNKGKVLGLDALTLSIGDSLTNRQNGKLLSAGLATFNAARAVNQGEWQANALVLQGNQLINTGRIQGDHGISVVLNATTSPSKLLNQGTLVSGGDSRISASAIENSGTLSTLGKATLTGDTLINARDIIADGALTLSGNYQGAGRLVTGGTLALSGEHLSNQGHWQGQDITLTGSTFDQQGALVGAQGITLTLTDTLTMGTNGQMLAGTTLNANAQRIDNQGFLQGNTLLLTADEVRNQGTLLGKQQFQLDAATGYWASALSALLSDGQGAINAKQLTLDGEIAAQRLTVTSDTLDNGGRLLGVERVDVTNTGTLTNRAGGELLSHGDEVVRSGSINNLGLMQGNTLQLQAATLDNAARIQGTQSLSLSGLSHYRGLQNGQLLSQGSATVSAQRIDNAGLWQAGTLQIDGDALENSGLLAGLNGMTLKVELLRNQGELFSQGSINGTGTRFDNAGLLTGLSGFELSYSDQINNLSNARLLSGGDGVLSTGRFSNLGLWQSDVLHLTAQQAENRAQLLGVNQADISLSGDFVNNGTGEVASGGVLTLAANAVDNAGTVQGQQLLLTAQAVTNQGKLRGQQTAQFTLGGTLSNASGAVISSDGTLRADAAAIDNRGTINAATVDLHGETLSNAGLIQGSNDVTLAGRTTLTNQTPGQVLSGGNATLSANLLNNLGYLQGRELVVQSQQLTQQGQMVAQGKLSLHIPQWRNQGTLQAQQLEIVADQLENQGTLLGLTQLALHTQRLTNLQGGKIFSAQDLLLDTAELNQQGQLLALGNLDATFTAPLLFTQQMAAGKRLSVTVNGDFDQRGTLQGDAVLLTSSGNFSNQGSIVSGAGESRITAHTFQQAEAGSIQTGGNLTLESDTSATNHGFIGTAGDLLVKAGGALENTSLLYAGGTMRLLTDSLTNRLGTILAGKDLWIQRDAQGNANTSVLNSSGTIETQNGDITIVTGDLTNQREGFVVTETEVDVSSQEIKPTGTTLVYTPEQLINEGGVGYYQAVIDIDPVMYKDDPESYYYRVWLPGVYNAYSRKEYLISEKSITVESPHGVGKINSGSNISITSRGVNNLAAVVFAKENILIDAAELNTHSYQSGMSKESAVYKYTGPEPDMAYNQWKRDIFDNSYYDDIYHFPRREEDVIVFTLQGTPTLEVTNGQSYNALIQAGGTISANVTHDISNTTVQAGNGNYTPTLIAPTLSSTQALSGVQQQNAKALSGKITSTTTTLIDLRSAPGSSATLSDSNATVTAAGKTLSLTPVSQTTLNTDTLTTGNSQLNAPQQGITSQTLTLQGPEQAQTAQTGGAIQPMTGGALSATETLGSAPVATHTDINLAQPNIVPVSSQTSATQTPIAVAQPGSVTLDPLKPQVENVSGTAPLSPNALLAEIQNGLQNLNNNAPVDYPLPTGGNGLMVLDPASDSRYLIHTNPKLDQLGQVDNQLFNDLNALLGQKPTTAPQIETSSQWTQADKVLGSEYLLGKLNLDAERDYRFLGDAAFDTRYISNAVLSQSGTRYLNGMGTDLQQMQYLLDNAASAQQALNLTLGVSLSDAQVAQLTHSIVWWENVEVNGQTVLAPKLYLAQADKTNVQGSAIVANTLDLKVGGSVTNSGTLKAVELLAIASGDKIDNQQGGIIASDGGLNLVALNNITNTSSQIKGNQVQLVSVNGDIVNDTVTRQWQTAAGSGALIYTGLGNTATISAAGSLNLSAGNDIRNTAATLSAAQDMTLAAGNNLALESLTLTNNRLDQYGGSTASTRSTTVQGSEILAGNAFSATAGKDLTIDASRVTAGSGLSLTAGQDILLSAQQTLAETASRSGVNAMQRTNQGISAAQLLSGGELSLKAGQDITAQAASLNAKGNAALAAGRDLNLLSEETETYSANNWKRHADWQRSEKQESTTVTAAGNLALSAGNDINLQAAQGTASGALTAQAGKNLNLVSATETEHTFFEETKVKKKAFSKTVTRTLRETEQTNEKASLLSGDSVTLAAGQDVNLQGSAIAGDKNVAIVAGKDVNTAASVENYLNYQEYQKKKSGLIGSGGIGFTIGSTSMSQKMRDQAATQSQSVSTIGSTTESVDIKAGQQVRIEGTDIVAKKDIRLEGSDVNLQPGYDLRKQQQETVQKSSGITIALSGVVGSALNSAVQSIQAATQESDSRLALLQSMKAGLSGYQAYQGSQSDLNNKGENAFVGVSISLGAQTSKSSQSSEQQQSFGTTLNAGQDVAITARSGDVTVAGSQVKAGGDIALNAAQDVKLLSARNTESMEGSNKSSGGAIGASIGVGNSGFGISIFANANVSKGRETGKGNTWSETTLDAGNKATVNAGRDTQLIGAQVSGERIELVTERDLLLQSQQDSERYDSKQTSASAGGSFSIGSMTGSGYLSFSKDKIHSNFDSVQQQTGLFAGSEGYSVKTGAHTQLDAAVIGSTASADKNALETGTLGWSGLDNKADFKVEHSGAGISMSPSMQGNMLSSLAMTMPSALMSLGSNGSASSTTYAAVSEGSLLIRDTANQQQDVTTLSHDVEHANNALSPIFNKEKEQQRLRQAQLIGEIGGQVMDIVRTEGEQRALKKAEESGEVGYPRPADDANDQDIDKKWAAYKAALTQTQSYKDEMKQYGVGSSYQQAAQAATAAIQALAGGDIKQAIAGGAAPYLAQLVKEATLPAKGEPTTEQRAANLMGHAIVGAVVAQLSGKDAGAGALGAASGELAAEVIRQKMFDGRDVKDLSESEKQSLSALSTLAAGLASGLASGNTADGASGAQAGRNAVENNSLSGDKARESVKQSAEYWKEQVRDKLGDGTTSAIANSIINAVADTGDAALGGADYVADAAMVLASCAAGDSYCSQALSDLSGKNQAAADTITALMQSETWSAVADTVKKASEGNQVALEATGGMLAGIILPGKKVPYVPNAGAVGNMKEFLTQPGLGSQIKNSAQKSSQIYQGQSIYKANSDIGDVIKKGDQFYLDGQHKNHLEVFDSKGKFKAVLNLDGTINNVKTEAAKGRKI